MMTITHATRVTISGTSATRIVVTRTSHVYGESCITCAIVTDSCAYVMPRGVIASDALAMARNLTVSALTAIACEISNVTSRESVAASVRYAHENACDDMFNEIISASTVY